MREIIELLACYIHNIHTINTNTLRWCNSPHQEPSRVPSWNWTIIIWSRDKKYVAQHPVRKVFMIARPNTRYNIKLRKHNIFGIHIYVKLKPIEKPLWITIRYLRLLQGQGIIRTVTLKLGDDTNRVSGSYTQVAMLTGTLPGSHTDLETSHAD